MATLCLIGGKSVDNTSNKIEDYILKLTNLSSPKILFCPYATMNNIENAKKKFLKQFENLTCEIKVMSKDDSTKFEELLSWCDILYVNGGCSDELIYYFNTFDMTKSLNAFLKTNKVYAGISAGAMLPCLYGMGDKDAYLDNFKMHNYKMVKCLGLLNIVICPHYQVEELIVFNDEIKKYNCEAFGIENDTMIVIDNNKFKAIKSNNQRSAYYFDRFHQMYPIYDKEWKNLCEK